MKQVILMAVDLLEGGTWGRGFSHMRPRGSLCVGEAFEMASKALRQSSYGEFSKKWYDLFGGVPPTWNDNECRSKEHAIERLREMANHV